MDQELRLLAAASSEKPPLTTPYSGSRVGIFACLSSSWIPSSEKPGAM